MSLGKKSGWVVALAVVSMFSLVVGDVQAGGQFPPLGNDTVTSMGTFNILVSPVFLRLVGCPESPIPGMDCPTRTLTSPLLFDPATVVGRSDPLIQGEDPADEDIVGVPVGDARTIVSDDDIVRRPLDMPEGPDGTREVHTELRRLNLIDTVSGAAVRAGTAFDLCLSPGEVESKSGNSGDPALDFPARSFFNVYVEVDIPGLGGVAVATLFNKCPENPLVLESDDLQMFPPTVVYTHDKSTQVNLRFKDDNPRFWHKNDVFGKLRVAGHSLHPCPAGSCP